MSHLIGYLLLESLRVFFSWSCHMCAGSEELGEVAFAHLGSGAALVSCAGLVRPWTCSSILGWLQRMSEQTPGNSLMGCSQCVCSGFICTRKWPFLWVLIPLCRYCECLSCWFPAKCLQSFQDWGVGLVKCFKVAFVGNSPRFYGWTQSSGELKVYRLH